MVSNCIKFLYNTNRYYYYFCFASGKKEVDVLVQWQDGSRNVVSNIDLVYRGPLKKKKLVKMRWGATWWRGQVMDFEKDVEKNAPLTSVETIGNEHLTNLEVAESMTASYREKEIPSETAFTPSVTHDPDIPNTGSHTDSQLNPLRRYEDISNSKTEICSNFTCKDEIFAACSICQCLLCFEHFVGDTNCESHNEFFYAYKITEEPEDGTEKNESVSEFILQSESETSFELLSTSFEEDTWKYSNSEDGVNHDNSATHTQCR
ncbi:uncharacterized protein LOC110986835 [Acanthaster planci]|uniref:Uncharacterized protein LOC110986835 n=1 Tax=Acanthaster planci TaxID=133434 RepID=A0A8B7ZN14_ACAPL|nr:uncharacterized protein LOC110986835 [Acanthaster planci]